MTDQTAARDRAIEDAPTEQAVERALKLQEGSVLAREVLRLRALAGAPTADVAEAPHPDPCSTCEGWGTVWSGGHYVPGEQFVEPPGAERCEDCVGTGMREVQERVRTAAPASVDAADEQDANRCSCGKPLRRCCYMCPQGPHEDLCDGLPDDDGMDLEAQGEMADQLDAAQAAIQRVRERCDERESRREWLGEHADWVAIAEIRAALDGDTTEEKR